METSIFSFFDRLYYRVSSDEIEKTFAFFSEDRKAVREAVERLSWSRNEKDQKDAIDFLSAELLPSEFIFLVLPGNYVVEESSDGLQYSVCPPYKDKWENAAKTIVSIGWPRVERIIVPLFMWLLDPNWPGSQIIRDFLCSICQNDLLKKIDEVFSSPELFLPDDFEDLKEQLSDLIQS